MMDSLFEDCDWNIENFNIINKTQYKSKDCEKVISDMEMIRYNELFSAP